MLPLTARVAPRSLGTSDPVCTCRAKGEDVALDVWVWFFPSGGRGAAKSPPPVSWSPTGASPQLAPSLCGGLNLGRQSREGWGGGSTHGSH